MGRAWLRTVVLAGLAVCAGPALGQQQPAMQAPAMANGTLTVVPQASTSENARSVMGDVQPSVIQIRGFFGSNTAQAFHGTGFAAGAPGLFVTNYHVVSERVHYPDQYRLEYRTTDGATGLAEVIAIDVRHDLAVIRAKDFAPRPLPIDPSPPVRGMRAYSVGFPLDVGLTITEGVSNGRVEDSFESRIHYSGALNAGMSGGPALNAKGQVIGANVSGYLFQQLVSFLVPAEYIAALLTNLPAEPPPSSALQAAMREQMRQHSVDLLGAIKGPFPTQSLAGFSLPSKIAKFAQCTAGGAPTSEDPVQTVRVSCGTKAGVYVQQGLSSGDIRYEHFVMSTDKLDSWRFKRRLASLSEARGTFGIRRHVAPFVCQGNVVALKGFDANVMICTRAYRKLEGLYDFVVRIVSLTPGTSGFGSHLDMYGVEFESAMKLVRSYVEAMSYSKLPVAKPQVSGAMEIKQ